MTKAIVLMNTEVGAEEDVARKLLEIPEVREVYIVYGVYDIIAIVESKDFDSLRTAIVSKVRRVPRVKSTTTLIVVEK